MSELYFCNISTDCNRTFSSQMIPCVSSERWKRTQKYRNEADQKLSIYAELLVRMIACDQLSVRNKNLMFVADQNGKPFLQKHPEFQFNISHTNNAIVVAISDQPIGADVEKIGLPNIEIAKRFFTENEYNHVISTPNSQDKRFYEIWTKKEAWIKCSGEGLRTPLNSFDVFKPEVKKHLFHTEINEYSISTCCRDGNVNITEITEEKIEDWADRLLSDSDRMQ